MNIDLIKLYNRAIFLAILTIVFNVVEGLVSIYFGLKDETLTLFGFGVDSFIETISAFGVLVMIYRIRANPNSERGIFEITALRITGWCFFALAAILTFSASLNLYHGVQPESTFAGVVIASISILTMWFLISTKIAVGKTLDSNAIISDAKCNQVCLYMSLVLLITSGLYEYFQIPHMDILGVAGLVYFSIKEGREAFNKARGIDTCCSSDTCVK
jgi:divalent metal cation (Fe/Co/Zn/Cd) transporter